MSGPTRTYTLSSTAWPRDVWQHGDERLMEHLMLLVSEGDIHADFGIEWHGLERDKPASPCLRAFDDAWRALPLVATTLASLADRRVQPAEVVAALEAIGFVPSEYNGQVAKYDQRRDRMEFERLRREHPEWFAEPPS